MPDASTTPFDAVAVARDMIGQARTVSLATLSPADGAPFASLATIASDKTLTPILLLSTLAVHTQNIAADARASLLFTVADAPAPDADPLVQSRVTLIGRIVKDDRPETRMAFLAHHPEAEMYADFADFAFYRFEFDKAHLVAGFGRIVEISARDLRMI